MTASSDRRRVLAGLILAPGLSGGLIASVGACKPRQSGPMPANPQTRADIKIDLSDLETTNGGRIGLSATDMNRVSWRGDERFNYCSTFKLFLAAAMIERVEHEQEKLDRAVPVTVADRVPNAPVGEAAIGKSLTIKDMMQAAVEVSDNICANILLRELGGLDVLRAWYRSAGDMITRVDRTEPMLNVHDGDKDTTQPNQIAQTLGWMLDTYDPLGFQSDFADLWSWMINSVPGAARIKGGVPEGWTVAHKTGTGGSGQTNDIGVIYPPIGQPIRIAIYYDAPATLDQKACDAVVAEATRRAVHALGRDVPVDAAAAS
ncbi:PEN family class A beta-lactamase, Bpc-type [soil metagenome]